MGVLAIVNVNGRPFPGHIASLHVVVRKPATNFYKQYCPKRTAPRNLRYSKFISWY